MTYEGKIVMPANYAAIESEEASRLEGGGFFLTALGVYGAYSVYVNLCDYIKNNTQKVQEFQKSVATGLSSFFSVFEKFAVLKVSFDIIKAIL